MLNPLAQILIEARTDPGRRPAFYHLLLAAEVYVIGKAGDQTGEKTLQPGSSVHIHHWQTDDGATVIPFFSSVEMLQKTIQKKESYLALNARDLFEMTRGMRLVLDPNQAHAKPFSIEEVAALLDGSLFQQTQSTVVKKETRVMLGQPRELPQAFMDALSSLFKTLPEVKAAYLAMISYEGSQDEPHLVIGVEVDGDYQAVIQQAGFVAGEVIGGEVVDFVEIGSGAISEYLTNSTRPFYTD